MQGLQNQKNVLMELRFAKNLENLLHDKGLNASTLSRRTGCDAGRVGYQTI
jgi:hypothetical protein